MTSSYRWEEVALDAPAKLTLSLHVTGARADGYHFLDAEMVAIDLVDTLCFSPGDALEVVDAGGGGAGWGMAEVPAGESNLVRRALAAIGFKAHVRLFKRIPAGAGLGGGSADAAAVLRWGERVGNPPGADLLAIAAQLGADVPFCLTGGARARVTGTGEVLEPLPLGDAGGQAYTLLTPPFGVSTAAVYRAWDEMGGQSRGEVNDLEQAALIVEPRLAIWRDRLAQATSLEPVLAGSGSTWFVRGEYPEAGRVVRVTPTIDKTASGSARCRP
ncbi:MAG TPA: 4-(cytidine 5'-diphospho)-2-C-methyl-D-erythritol kinase [Acidimicrobiales bacterium]|nr:4-(cytidine 5'-diphospho)-2-C-methyl-D-erythritol kinase [Acidimicrobiales bacterium]